MSGKPLVANLKGKKSDPNPYPKDKKTKAESVELSTEFSYTNEALIVLILWNRVLDVNKIPSTCSYSNVTHTMWGWVASNTPNDTDISPCLFIPAEAVPGSFDLRFAQD